jgi:phosphatidylinositol alpha 1,6-mannosyltransferase
VRIVLIAESFLPNMNGVTHSVLKVLQHLRSQGDDALIVAPSSTDPQAPDEVEGFPVHRVPSLPLAGYTNLRVAFGWVNRIKRILSDFQPDVVHLASPFELGWRAARAAALLNLPTVAVYQTEVPSYAGRYGVPFLENWAWNRVENIHLLATRTLAPSSFAVNQLRGHGIPRIHLWRRGVDTARFSPQKRNGELRARAGAQTKKIIGYVGRLAAEKQVADLAAIADIPGTQLVIVGEGPLRGQLEQQLPNAFFTGFMGGEDLAHAVADFDLFVHPGEFETFCQTIQEAMASGVPVVATGRGGPLDLVDNSRTGWLYTPGDLAGLRNHVMDLIGDDAKRSAFAKAAHHTVQGRTWSAVCGQLTDHYQAVIVEHRSKQRQLA